MSFESLASYKKFKSHLQKNWPAFQARRNERLRAQARYGEASERVTENIVEDLLTVALDWGVGEIDHQVGYADMLITRNRIKYCVIETKRPGALAWNPTAVQHALTQVRRYADEQSVKSIAISDGIKFYVADLEAGGLRDRILVSLKEPTAHLDLWWISQNGIHRPRIGPNSEPITLLRPEPESQGIESATVDTELLHPKYELPCTCFAYVGNANKPSTWKLPYMRADGSVDEKRLPKAIQAIITNYRGARISTIPEASIPDVLVRLAAAAERLGKMPQQGGKTAEAYELLADALDQVKKG
jgi:hypothetical protein